MTVQPKDIKLLWGNAARMCSMPDCRIPLTSEPEQEDEIGGNEYVVGEMAHIVGEKNSEKSPRGLSDLPVERRNLYSNLILLCPTHHTEIDKNVEDWPVERLHVIKREHELWVDERLGRDVDDQILIYHDFIDRVALTFHLDNWEWLCDHLFRQVMPEDFPTWVDQLGFEYFRAVFPRSDAGFESALKNVVERSQEYLAHYMSEAEIRPGDPRILAKKRYRDAPEEDYEVKDKLLKVHNKWDRNCTLLLCNLVLALNEFAENVRKELRKDFYIRKGLFCVHDFMGLMGGSLKEQWILPQRYYTKEELASQPDTE